MRTNNSLLDAAQSYDVVEVVNRGLAYAIIIAGFLSVVFIFIGGISFILSGGQEEKIKQAVGTIRYAIIGLIVSFFSVFIISLVGQAIGLNVVKYINLGEVVGIISSVVDEGRTNSIDSL
jgi:uncharacterized membrane protein